MSEDREEFRYLKPLDKVKRLGWSLNRVLVVDDTPAKLERNFGNAIYPSPYMGAEDDRELELLGKYLLRSDEHTSELQSLMRISYAVFCLKKKKRNNTIHTKHHLT